MCKICDEEKSDIASALGICPSCARKKEARVFSAEVHRQSLSTFGLGRISESGKNCSQCVNQCRLEEGEKGLCGLRVNQSGTVHPILSDTAVVDWYYDPIPTNCVAEWTCSANKSGASGKKNLAVFFHGCTFDCLFCQNWHNKEGLTSLKPQKTLDLLIRSVDADTFCVCFFGGDPTPQLEFAFKACDEWLRGDRSAPKICWETNGSMSPALSERIAEISLGTGGIVKFDLKAFDENLHYALCGASNKHTLHNFKKLTAKLKAEDEIHLVASTLLVPKYIDAKEVSMIASFIAELDDTIPYSLLAFHPDYLMMDLPRTSLAEANEAYSAAKRAGLKNVNIGNIHLLH